MTEACCTCATLLANVLPLYDEKTEKPKTQDRQLDCCQRIICGNCIYKNSRFATYCPFCQISKKPTSLPQGLHDPPAYTPPSSSLDPPTDQELPSYSSLNNTQLPPPEKIESNQPAEDVLHFLDHSQDTLAGLSLRYGVPLAVLRRVNNITSDHLLHARRTILIPGEFYKGGVSLSPRPIEGEEEEIRKAKVFKFQRACKVAEYDVALLYLKQAEYDLDMAVDIYRDDERWEREHPVNGKGKVHQDVGKRRFTGQR